MSDLALSEADVESAALDWLAGLGWQVAYGPDIAPDAPGAERAEYGQVVLEQRLRGNFRPRPIEPKLPMGVVAINGQVE